MAEAGVLLPPLLEFSEHYCQMRKSAKVLSIVIHPFFSRQFRIRQGSEEQTVVRVFAIGR